MSASRPPAALKVRGRELPWGARTYVMGIVNVTPDSFRGDGLLRDREHALQPVLETAVAQAVRMVEEGADIIDVGGESTRPGHEPVSEAAELARVTGVVTAIRARLPDLLISIDTSKPGVAEAALAAGADIVNDVSAVTAGSGVAAGTASAAASAGARGANSSALARVAAAGQAPYIVMHDRALPIYDDVVGEVVEDLRAALDRAQEAGCLFERLIVDPGIGFGKTAEQNLRLLAGLAALRTLGRPVLLGTSRKSTIGKVLDLPVEDRLEGTLATTALGVAALVDIVRVHDVAANVRAARMSDAIIRGGWHDPDAR